MKIGIDIGGSHIGVGLVDNAGNILQKEEIDLVNAKREGLNLKSLEVVQNIEEAKNAPIQHNEENNFIEQLLIRKIVKFINKILKDVSIPINSIEKIGVASPGNIKNGIVKNANNLGIKEFNIVEELKKYYDIPIFLRNDAKCAGIAENEFGALKQYDNSVFLTIGTGIGGAVFWNGKLLEPKENTGFEVGHIVIEKDGKQCKCGNKGCLEKYASITALKEYVSQKYQLESEITGLQLYNFIQENINNQKMREVIEEYTKNLSIGIGNLINIFEPEAVCLGGSITYYKDIILKDIIMKLPQYCFNANLPQILIAKYKNDAGIIGACL